MANGGTLPSDPDFARQVEQAEVSAWLSLASSEPDGRQLEFRSVEGATLILDRSQDWNHTRILNLGVAKPASSEMLSVLLNEVRRNGISQVSAFVSPIARPSNLVRMLAEEGFSLSTRSVVIARDTSFMDEPDDFFRIRQGTNGDREQARDFMVEVLGAPVDFCALLADQIERPGWLYLIAWEGNRIGALAGIHTQGEVAWLSPIWTRPEYRNRGTQAALIAAAVQEAKDAGARWITGSHPATVPGRTRNFSRLGFEVVYLRSQYDWSASQC